MKRTFYYKSDPNHEAIGSGWFLSRLAAARHFAGVKKLKLREFLKLYSISR